MQKYKTILGAGAMIPFGGPTTDELTQRLLGNPICKKEFYPIYARTNKTGNFELLLSSIEFLLDLKNAKEELGSKGTNPYMLLESNFLYQNDSTMDIWKIYCEAINEIIERIKEYDYYSSPYPNKIDTLAEFLIGKKQTNTLKIYSLNYDRLIPKTASKKGLFFYEGFKDLHYNYDLNEFNTCPYTFFNLHGSIYTSYNIEGISMASETPIMLEHPYYIHGGNPGERKLFLPIIAGYSKSQRVLSEPFNLGIAAFMNDCNTCNRIVVVGYSFGDPYINSILNKFIRLNTTEIIIVDYFEGEQLPKRLRAIPYQVFGIRGATYIGNNSMLYLDKNPLIRLYIKGFEQYMIDNLQK